MSLRWLLSICVKEKNDFNILESCTYAMSNNLKFTTVFFPINIINISQSLYTHTHSSSKYTKLQNYCYSRGPYTHNKYGHLNLHYMKINNSLFLTQ